MPGPPAGIVIVTELMAGELIKYARQPSVPPKIVQLLLLESITEPTVPPLKPKDKNRESVAVLLKVTVKEGGDPLNDPVAVVPLT
jgi:hypothetical protein